MVTQPLLAPDEASFDEATVDLLLSNMGTDMVLVGGQALVFWVSRHGVQRSDEVISNDGDALGEVARAVDLAKAIKARVELPSKASLTTIVAQLSATGAGRKRAKYRPAAQAPHRGRAEEISRLHEKSHRRQHQGGMAAEPVHQGHGSIRLAGIPRPQRRGPRRRERPARPHASGMGGSSGSTRSTSTPWRQRPPRTKSSCVRLGRPGPRGLAGPPPPSGDVLAH